MGTKAPTAGNWPTPPPRECQVTEVLSLANRQADWARVAALYRQSRETADTVTRAPAATVTEALAEAMSTVAVNYPSDGREMCEHTLAIFADVDGGEVLDAEVFDWYYENSPLACPVPPAGSGRRAPTVYETAVESTRRRRDAYLIARALRQEGIAVILGGSVCYGPYYNVRGFRNGFSPSDLDVIVVVPDSGTLRDAGDLLSKVPGIAPPDLSLLMRRAKIFAGRYDNGSTVFSHRMNIWDRMVDPILPRTAGSPEYPLSLHFLTDSVLSYLLVESATRLVKDVAGGIRTVWDYRNTQPGSEENLRSFAGQSRRRQVSTRLADLGYLSRPTGYAINEFDAYFPGTLQTLLFSTSELCWDGCDLRPRLLAFSGKIRERLRYERAGQSHTVLRPTLAHVRGNVFAPHVARELDARYATW